MAKYFQGKYTPKNPKKYSGDATKIFFRSSWELKLFNFFDSNPNIVSWNSEEIQIPYISPLDGRAHRYFVDCAALMRQKDGSLKKYLVEVKPLKQVMPPEQKSRKTKRYLEEVTTYMVNQAKWKAAMEFCNKNGWTWQIITERELGLV